jgi:hypothetical protein
MTYYRMTQDNEIVAARAGGLSHRAILVPALASGLVLAAILAGLNAQVIPRFLSAMERMVTRDLSSMLVRNVERGEAIDLGDTQIFADGVRNLGPNPLAGHLDRLALSGVALTEASSGGTPGTWATAERAFVILLRGEEAGFDEASTAGAVVLENGVGFVDGEVVDIGSLQLGPFRVPDAFSDDPKFLTSGELADLPREPDSMSFIQSRRERLARALATLEAIDGMQQALPDAAFTFAEPGGGRVILRAGPPVHRSATRWALPPHPDAGVVEAERLTPRPDGGRDIEVMTARGATLRLQSPERAGDMIEIGGAENELRFTLALQDATLRRAASATDAASRRPSIEIAGLAPDPDPMQRYAQMPARRLLRISDDVGVEGRDGSEAAARFLSARRELRERLAKLEREVIGKQHERYAASVSVLVMLCTGAVVAIRFGTRLPLVVYLAAFGPALFATLLISAGTQHTESDGVIEGLAVLWGGVAALTFFTVALFSLISRR